MNRIPNILFTATFSTPFIREDLSFLQKHFRVTPVISSGPWTFLRWLPGMWKSDISFSWFASVYSSILVLKMKLLGRRSVIVLGGVDVARMPEFNYGVWNSRWRSVLVRYGITHADIVLAVDESLKQDAIRLAKYDGKNIRVVPTGYDADRWSPLGNKERFILTVAHCDTVTRAMIKGIDFLAETAKVMPEEKFVLVGITPEVALHFHLPKNITVVNAVSQDELLRYYRSAMVYFQPSRREGLPNSLCEAMLCSCTSVGTETGGIPNAIGECGTVIPFGDTDKALTALKSALSGHPRSSSRERIKKMFTREQRETQLRSAIESLVHG